MDLSSVPAIRRIDTDRDDLVAFEIGGPLSGPDVENLYGLLEGAYALNVTVDLLIRAPDGEAVEWDGVDQSTIESGRDHARTQLRRCAIVGGSGAVASLVKALSDTSRTEYRHFGLEQEAEAWGWLNTPATKSRV